MSYTPNQEKLLIGQNGGLVTSGGLVAGNLINIRVLTSGTNATYTPTAGTRLIYVEMCGGGGGGGSATTTTTAQVCFGRGGTSSSVYRALVNIEGALTGTYTIGTGGVRANGSTPTDGGQSSLTINGVTLNSGYGAAGSNDFNLQNYGSFITQCVVGPGFNGNSSGDLTKILFSESMESEWKLSYAGASGGNFLLYNGGNPGNYFTLGRFAFTVSLGISQQTVRFQNTGTSMSVSVNIDSSGVSGRYGMGGCGPIILGVVASLSGQNGNQGVIKIWEYA